MGAGDEVVDLDAIMHDLRADAADPLARIRHGTYIADGLALVAEVERLREVERKYEALRDQIALDAL